MRIYKCFSCEEEIRDHDNKYLCWYCDKTQQRERKCISCEKRKNINGWMYCRQCDKQLKGWDRIKIVMFSEEHENEDYGDFEYPREDTHGYFIDYDD